MLKLSARQALVHLSLTQSKGLSFFNLNLSEIRLIPDRILIFVFLFLFCSYSCLCTTFPSTSSSSAFVFLCHCACTLKHAPRTLESFLLIRQRLASYYRHLCMHPVSAHTHTHTDRARVFLFSTQFACVSKPKNGDTQNCGILAGARPRATRISPCCMPRMSIHIIFM